MANNKGKNILIHLLSSDDVTASDSSISSSSSEDECELIDDVDEVDDDDGGSEEDEEEDDDHSLSNKVIHFLHGGRGLQQLSVKDCKAYLRRHALRVSGNKDECVHRVKEHWRIKDGNAEVLYPRSSFVINCTGDVCKGDTVLFQQKVHGCFDKVTRKGKLLGKRTVAGRVVKESYGAAKQQHTFTVEVLWSKGIRNLPPLFPLLIKGRNLYRLRTCRQPWKNEGERRKVLAEKHRRGAAARYTRSKRKNALSANKGGNSRKVSHCGRPSQTSCSKGDKHFGTELGASSSTHSATACNRKQNNVTQRAAKNTSKAKFIKSLPSPQKLVLKDNRASTLQSYRGATEKYSESIVRHYHRIEPYDSRSAEFQAQMSYHAPMMMPAEHYGLFSQRPFHGSYGIQSPQVVHMDSRQLFPTRIAHGHWIHDGLLNCSIHGCNEPGSNRCAIVACWRCCRRVGMECNVHR